MPLSALENLVDELEKELRGQLEMEIPSSQIGELVMNKLKALDQVAYVRFASVYRQFQDLSSFLSELKKIMKGSPPRLDH